MDMEKERYKIMPVQRLKNFLDQNKVSYRIISHPLAYTSQETAQAAFETGKEFAKTVMLKVNGELWGGNCAQGLARKKGRDQYLTACSN